jgi:dephospho-CoA kinase
MKQILAIVGMTGSGKSTVVEHLAASGVPVVYFGGLVLEEVKNQGLAMTETNEKPIREMLRQQHGKQVFAKHVADRVKELLKSGHEAVILDGLYSWSEYQYLVNEFQSSLRLIAVVSPKELRYQRLKNREIRPLTEEEATLRDISEIENLEKGGPIAYADYYVLNNAGVKSLHAQVDDLLNDMSLKN